MFLIELEAGELVLWTVTSIPADGECILSTFSPIELKSSSAFPYSEHYIFLLQILKYCASYLCKVSSPLDISKRFTLQPLATLFIMAPT